MSVGARRILRNVGYRTAADLGGKLASFVLYVAMARKLGASDFGVFTFSFTFITLVTMPATFGQDSLLSREVARDHSKAQTYFTNMVGLKLSLAVPALGLAVAGLAAISGRETVVVSLLLGLANIAQLLMNTCFGIFQAFERLGPTAAVVIGQRLLTAAAALALLAMGAGVVAVSAVFLATTAFALVVAVGLMSRKITHPSLRIDLKTWRPLMRAAIPIGVASVASLVLFRIDTVMLAAFKPESVVGNYGAAYRLLETTLFTTWAVGAAVFPVFSRLSRSSDPPVTLVFERSVKLGTAAALPLGVGAAIFAPSVIGLLYGHQYASAADALRLLAPAIALYPVTYLAGDLLIAQRRQTPLTLTYIAVAIENVLLNLLLIPRWSLNGAAFGTSFSQLLVLVPLIYVCQRDFGRIDWVRVLAGPAIASAVAVGLMALLRETFGVALAAGSIAYICLLLLFERLVFPEDARVLSGWSGRLNVSEAPLPPD